MTLTSKVDGIVVVTRMKVVRRHMLGELARQLASVRSPVLGFVVTDAVREDEGYGYGYGWNYAGAYAPSERAKAASAYRLDRIRGQVVKLADVRRVSARL